MQEINKPTILCIDDEKIVLESLRGQLKLAFGHEYKIEIAESGFDAINITHKIFRDTGIPPHLIICDQIMPGMKGDEVLDEINQEFPQIPSILLTGKANKNDIIAVINKTRLYKYVEKPWNYEDLNATVKEALNSNKIDQDFENRYKRLLTLNNDLKEIIKEKSSDVLKQKEELEIQKIEIIQSLNRASLEQSNLLPSENELRNLFSEHFTIYTPLKIVSGGLYWIKKIDDLIFVSVVNCIEHGVTGELLSMLAYDLLSTSINSFGLVEPASILNNMHRSLITILNQETSALHDKMDVSIVCFNTSTKIMKFSGANSSLSYFKNGKLTVLKGDSISVGGISNLERKFQQHNAEYNNPMSFYMNTNRYFDQYEEKNSKITPKDSLGNTLLNNCMKSFKEQGDGFQKIITAHHEKFTQTEDIVVLGFKLN